MIRNRGGYWQVKVYAGLDPLTGKQRFESYICLYASRMVNRRSSAPAA